MTARSGKAKRFQTPDSYKKRSDHVWARTGTGWKCCLCGALVKGGDPPDFPTPLDWRKCCLCGALVPAGNGKGVG